jgi:DhnA family fructose-bisphosphate aldolase class Ia
MSDIGKKARLSRVFSQDGHSLIVAMDHAATFGPMAGLEKPGELIEKVIEGGADAIMTTFGVVKQFYHLLQGRVGVILRVDGGPTSYGLDAFLTKGEWNLLYSVEEAVKLGADGVIAMAFLGVPGEGAILKGLASVAERCQEWGMPLLVETLPILSEKINNPYDAEHVSVAARIAQEYGADFIKTNYTGNSESFSRVTGVCAVPVLIAGGPKMDSPREVLEVVKGSVDAGGKGVVFGRNIWQYKDPAAMTRAIANIVHEGATVMKALKEL